MERSKPNGFASQKSYDGKHLKINGIDVYGKQTAANVSYESAKNLYFELPQMISTRGYTYPNLENPTKKQLDLIVGSNDYENSRSVKDNEIYQKTRQMFENFQKDVKEKLIQYMIDHKEDNEYVKVMNKKIGRKEGPLKNDERIQIPSLIKYPDIDNDEKGPYRLNAKNKLKKDSEGNMTVTTGKGQVVKLIDSENGGKELDIDEEGPSLGKGSVLKCVLSVNLLWLIQNPQEKKILVYPDLQVNRIEIIERSKRAADTQSLADQPRLNELGEEDDILSKELKRSNTNDTIDDNEIPLVESKEDEDVQV